MNTIQINTVSTVDAVRNALETDILSLHFAPGSKLTESDLSVRYNVSRNTVREAIAHLLAQGLLTKVANRGVFVRKFTVEDVQEIFHLRALLELEAVNTIFATDQSPTHLYSLVEELEGKTCGQPGEVIKDGKEFTVACGSGALRLTVVQLEGKGRLEGETFLRGSRLEPGFVLG